MYKTIPNFENYIINKCGNIISIKTNRLKAQWNNNHNYKVVQLWNGGKGYSKLVHRLILETFVGPCPNGMEACHNNSINTDNRLDNLRWDTPKNNHRDAIKRGTHSSLLKGENAGGAKITDAQVVEIFRIRNNLHWYQKDIAKLFNISQSQVGRILSKKSRC